MSAENIDNDRKTLAVDISRYSDGTTTVDELKRLVVQFSEERDWGHFHTPKNLALSASIEAAELLEHFQWLTPDESFEIKNDPTEKKAVAEEISDVVSYLLNLCAKLDVDLASEFVQKMCKNAVKYPVPSQS